MNILKLASGLVVLLGLIKDGQNTMCNRNINIAHIPVKLGVIR